MDPTYGDYTSLELVPYGTELFILEVCIFSIISYMILGFHKATFLQSRLIIYDELILFCRNDSFLCATDEVLTYGGRKNPSRNIYNT